MANHRKPRGKVYLAWLLAGCALAIVIGYNYDGQQKGLGPESPSPSAVPSIVTSAPTTPHKPSANTVPSTTKNTRKPQSATSETSAAKMTDKYKSSADTWDICQGNSS